MSGDRRFGDIVDELVTKLTGHLVHEESEGRDLIDATLSAEEWQNFARSHGQRLLGDASTYVPWLLEGASPETVEGFLANIPPPLAASYRGQWAPSLRGRAPLGQHRPAGARRHPTATEEATPCRSTTRSRRRRTAPHRP